MKIRTRWEKYNTLKKADLSLHVNDIKTTMDNMAWIADKTVWGISIDCFD